MTSHSDFLMKAGEGENAQTYGFVYVPLKNRDDEHNDDEDIEKRVRRVTRTVIENFAPIFLEDAWGLDECLSQRVTIVFAEKLYYEAFWESIAKRTINHDMTALLVDTEEKKVIEEKTLGRQEGKSTQANALVRIRVLKPPNIGIKHSSTITRFHRFSNVM